MNIVFVNVAVPISCQFAFHVMDCQVKMSEWLHCSLYPCYGYVTCFITCFVNCFGCYLNVSIRDHFYFSMSSKAASKSSAEMSAFFLGAGTGTGTGAGAEGMRCSWSRSSCCRSDHRCLLRCTRTVNLLLLGAGRTGGRWRGEITLAFIVALHDGREEAAGIL